MNANSAINLLGESVNLAIVNGNRTETFNGRGIKILLDILKTDAPLLSGAYVADKIVGKAAAMLFVKGRVKEIYAGVLSESAVEVLKKYKIPYTFGTLTPNIKNRAGTGLCPMENAVLSVDDPENAFEALIKTSAALAGNKNT